MCAIAVVGAADGAGLLARSGAETGAEQLVVALRHAEQVGDDEHGERLAVAADELAVAALDELVDLAIGQPPHELLVLAQPLRRDQAHEQRAVRGVDRRVEREQLVAHRQRVAVLLDERVDVVALERHREAGERPGGRVARRERRGVVVDRDRFVVAGHHHHVVVRLAADRALRAQPVEVRVRVGDELVAAEEVDRVVVRRVVDPAPRGYR